MNTAMSSQPAFRSLRLQRQTLYVSALAWAFTLFNTARVFAYLPTLWVIYEQADSRQHSLVTWITWLGANLTMSAWLYEENGGWSKPVLVNGCNAAMCLIVVATIVAYRF